LKTRPIPVLGSLPLAFALPVVAYYAVAPVTEKKNFTPTCRITCTTRRRYRRRRRRRRRAPRRRSLRRWSRSTPTSHTSLPATQKATPFPKSTPKKSAAGSANSLVGSTKSKEQQKRFRNFKVIILFLKLLFAT